MAPHWSQGNGARPAAPDPSAAAPGGDRASRRGLGAAHRELRPEHTSPDASRGARALPFPLSLPAQETRDPHGHPAPTPAPLPRCLHRNQRRVRPGSFPCSRSTCVIPPRRRAPERYRSQLLGNSSGRACMSAPPWQGGRGRSPSRKSRFLEARDAAGVLQAGGTASGKPGCTARAQDPKCHPEGPRCPQRGAAPNARLCSLLLFGL